jgi:hypothetical protein
MQPVQPLASGRMCSMLARTIADSRLASHRARGTCAFGLIHKTSAQELRIASKGGEAVIAALEASQPDALKLAHKLAYSFTDSVLQSSAPLTMRPQQQALCAVCHALVKYGMPKETAVERYAMKAQGGAGAQAPPGREAVIQAIKVQCHCALAQCTMPHCALCGVAPHNVLCVSDTFFGSYFFISSTFIDALLMLLQGALDRASLQDVQARRL